MTVSEVTEPFVRCGIQIVACPTINNGMEKMKRCDFVGLLVGFGLCAVSANAAQTEGNIKTCATSLPSGHTFELNINVKISTTGNEPEFDGGFQFRDGTGAMPAPFSQESVQPFIECIQNLLG